MRKEIGRIEKGKAALIEYSTPYIEDDPTYFIQMGIVGLWLNSKELKDLKTVLDYYTNVDDFLQCKIKVDGEYVATS